MEKTALITGVTGQDGSYIAELLLNKDYFVYGLDRRKADISLTNIKGFIDNPNFQILTGDLLEQHRIMESIKKIQPDEIYHLGSQSFVKASWDVPLYTCDVNAMGTLRILEAIRCFSEHTKFYHASSSEIFGQIAVEVNPQIENTYHYPVSPYACSKSFAHNITRNYRESYGMFCCNGICFNHESERRGLEFVTRKITHGVALLESNNIPIQLGNLDSKRDWGYAPDYVKAMYLMLQHDQADDYIVSTGRMRSIREFVEIAFKTVGKEIFWEGSKEKEVGCDNNGHILVKVAKEFFRPVDVKQLVGDSSKINNILGWKPTVTFEQMVKRMVNNDIQKMV